MRKRTTATTVTLAAVLTLSIIPTASASSSSLITPHSPAKVTLSDEATGKTLRHITQPQEFVYLTASSKRPFDDVQVSVNGKILGQAGASQVTTDGKAYEVDLVADLRGLPRGASTVVITVERGNRETVYKDRLLISPSSRIKPLSVNNYRVPGETSPSVYGGWRTEQEPNAGGGGPISTDRISVVGAQLTPGTGKYRPTNGSMKVTLKPYESSTGAADGDVTNTGGFLANRAEVYGRYPDQASSTPAEKWADPVGSTRYYNFAVMIPEDFTFATDTKWTTLTQWKGFRGGSPPLALEIKRDSFILGGAKGYGVPKSSLGKVQKGVWTEFTVGMHMSPDASKGWVEVYRDGNLITPRANVATMDMINGKVDPIYLKQGIYRTKAWNIDHTVYFGPTTITDRRIH